MIVSQTETGRDGWGTPSGWETHELFVRGGRVVAVQSEGPGPGREYEPGRVYLGQVYRRLTGHPEAGSSLEPIDGGQYAALARLLAGPAGGG